MFSKGLSKALAGGFMATNSGRLLSGGGGDDGTSSLIHIILLLVLSGIILCSSLHVLQHKSGMMWFPEAGTSLLVGLIFGAIIRSNVDDEASIPEELGFTGSIFFLILLPIIIFEGGFSLRKKEFFSQLGSILFLSIAGTVISGLTIGGILYSVGQNGWSTPLEMNEALAYGSVLANTDSLAVTQQLQGIGGIDASFQALVYGEGAVNEATALVMYDVFTHFIDDHGSDETAAYAFSRFAALLAGSTVLGLAIGALSCWIFRLVHMDWRPDVLGTAADGIERLCCRRAGASQAEQAAARMTLLRASPFGVSTTLTAPPSSTIAALFPPTQTLAVQSAAAAAGLPPNFDPAEIVRKPPSFAALRVAAMCMTKEERMTYEPKPSSSVFLQTSYILAMGYVSYMAAEACLLSGVVAVLFTGISMNHFIRPLLTKEGKRFSEGTIKVLSQTSDTSIFFQVGLDMGLTVASKRGIDTGKDGALLGWVIFSVLLGRAITVGVLGIIANYYRRTPIPWQYLIALWHCGMRGAGTYAFTLIFPTANRDLLLDVTASAMLFTVFGVGGTMVPLMKLLGIPHDPIGAHGAGHGHEDKEGGMQKGIPLGHGIISGANIDGYIAQPGKATFSVIGAHSSSAVPASAMATHTSPPHSKEKDSTAQGSAALASAQPKLERSLSGYSLVKPSRGHGGEDRQDVGSGGSGESESEADSDSDLEDNPARREAKRGRDREAKRREKEEKRSRERSSSVGTPRTPGGLRSPSRPRPKQRSSDHVPPIVLSGDPMSFQQAATNAYQAGEGGRESRHSADDTEEQQAGAGAGSISRAGTVALSIGTSGETYAYRTVMVGGAQARVPVFTGPSTSEKAVSGINSTLAVVRYYVSGVLRD